MQGRSSKVILNRIYAYLKPDVGGLKWVISVSLLQEMTQQKRKFKLKLELKFSRHSDNLQIRRHLKLDFGVRVCNISLSFTILFTYK